MLRRFRFPHCLCSLYALLFYNFAFGAVGANSKNNAEQQQKLHQDEKVEGASELHRLSELRELAPRSAAANAQLGLAQVSSGDYAVQKLGISHLSNAIDPEYVDDAFPLESPQGLVISSTVGRWYIQMNYHHTARPVLEAASNANPNDLCMAVMLTTSLIATTTPKSILEADKNIERYLSLTERLLRRLAVADSGSSSSSRMPHWKIDQEFLSQFFPGAGPDPYEHCMISIFALSFNYRADVALVARRYYDLGTRIWPELSYISGRAQTQLTPNYYLSSKYNITTMQSPSLPSSASSSEQRTSGQRKRRKRQKKIHLGIASGHLGVASSVTEDFKGTMSRLDRSKFKVTYIPIQDAVVDPFVYAHPEDNVLLLKKQGTDFGDGAWVKRYHPLIEALELDILFYLDLTMSPQATRVAYAKLAPVQATSHGHPVTSGIPSTIMNYYISWGAAELDYDTAKAHYTEQLIFLPTHSLHQFYTPRANDDISLINGQNYRVLVNGGRAGTFPSIPPDRHWYTCMQKPFKFSPEMDELLCQILMKDSQGQIVLHAPTSDEAQNVFHSRLAKTGCDMSRILFLDALEHHRLLALYALSDVILDSYPAGGCTTTREVLAIGKALVTLPARLLGSRWSLAYYRMMGDEELNRLVIAGSPSEYVELAVNLGASLERRKDVERRIKRNVHKLYERWDSVRAWEDIFEDIALPEDDEIVDDDNDDYNLENLVEKDEL